MGRQLSRRVRPHSAIFKQDHSSNDLNLPIAKQKLKKVLL